MLWPTDPGRNVRRNRDAVVCGLVAQREKGPGSFVAGHRGFDIDRLYGEFEHRTVRFHRRNCRTSFLANTKPDADRPMGSGAYIDRVASGDEGAGLAPDLARVVDPGLGLGTPLSAGQPVHSALQRLVPDWDEVLRVVGMGLVGFGESVCGDR